jgi:hypothetical protein
VTKTHPVIEATRVAARAWHRTPDGRLVPHVEPDILELRVSPGQLERALCLAQAVIEQGIARGMIVSGVERDRKRRPGVAIGRGGSLTALAVKELRCLVPFAEVDEDTWREDTRLWWYEAEALEARGLVPRPSGRLRLVLPRRYGGPPRQERGWRFSFTDQTGRALETQIGEVLSAIEDRSSSND